MLNLLDTWIYVKPAAWEALADNLPEGVSEYNYSQAVTGMWNSYPGGFEVYNLLCTESELQVLIDTLGDDLAHAFAWQQGTGMDNFGIGETIPAEVLAVMPDRIIDDAPVPATLENPNWVHVFVDQRSRIFAGDFANEFNEEFF